MPCKSKTDEPLPHMRDCDAHLGMSAGDAAGLGWQSRSGDMGEAADGRILPHDNASPCCCSGPSLAQAWLHRCSHGCHWRWRPRPRLRKHTCRPGRSQAANNSQERLLRAHSQSPSLQAADYEGNERVPGLLHVGDHNIVACDSVCGQYGGTVRYYRGGRVKAGNAGTQVDRGDDASFGSVRLC